MRWFTSIHFPHLSQNVSTNILSSLLQESIIVGNLGISELSVQSMSVNCFYSIILPS